MWKAQRHLETAITILAGDDSDLGLEVSGL